MPQPVGDQPSGPATGGLSRHQPFRPHADRGGTDPIPGATWRASCRACSTGWTRPRGRRRARRGTRCAFCRPPVSPPAGWCPGWTGSSMPMRCGCTWRKAPPSIDFARNDADFVIQWGDAPTPGLVVEPLMVSQRFPVASPTLIAAARLETPQDRAARHAVPGRGGRSVGGLVRGRRCRAWRLARRAVLPQLRAGQHGGRAAQGRVAGLFRRRRSDAEGRYAGAPFRYGHRRIW